MRKQYRTRGLAEDELAADPYTQFARWFADAVNGGIDEPNAMVVSTADAEGRPGSRTVLLKSYDHRGFVFFTNYRSRKGRELGERPYASLLFPWHPIARQVIVGGRVERVTREETEAYFRSRPHGSRIGAWASEQSSTIASREELERRYAELAERWPEDADVPVPPHWGGFRVVARTVEFWQGRENRLHDRLLYEADGGTPAEGGWTVRRLAP
ncbi:MULTISPECIES: pyridoxamine 5'-phosphate oxidase [unclassified Streptomyces]|uniref:pyridoxamine 5'-phosphate oxidase n=1 Tax=unclassified Streptomyces TaxID=2593676 RepID=UPI00382DD857